MTPELQAKIQIWRAKAARNEMSIDEMKEAIKALREGRVGAHVASDKARTTRAKARVEVPTADDLLARLGAIGGAKPS